MFLKNKKKTTIIFLIIISLISIREAIAQDQNPITIGLTKESPLIFISDPEYYNPNNIKNSDFSGIIIDIFNYIGANLNISYKYELIESKNNLTTDMVLYSPNDYNFDKGFDPVYYYLKNVTANYLKTDDILKESYYIFYPSLLATLIQRVLWELFFILFIVIFPWIMINAQIYYFFDSRKFRHLPFHKGFFKALTAIICRESDTKCGQIYSIFFLAATSVVCMLILADFIYTIANMITKYDISNVFDLINNKATICLYSEEFFQINFLRNIPQISVITKTNIADCFYLIENLRVDALLISEYFIKNFFKYNPNYNNVFRFYVKQNSFKTYSFLIQNTLNRTTYTNINQLVNIMASSETLTNILSKYLVEVKYDKLNPSSILIESALLILISLTVTSLFILTFLIIAIRRIIKKSQTPKKKSLSQSNTKKNKESNGKNINNDDNWKNIQSENSPKNSLTYQRIKAQIKKKSKQDEEVVLNSELRKLNYNNEFIMNSQKRHTLSLSGPILIFDGQINEEPNKKPKIPFESKKDLFSNQDVSSVQRVDSFKSASGLGSVFENDLEEENKENL